MRCRKLSPLTAVLTLLIVDACTGASVYAPVPQSAFTPPNSDVVPGQHVKATVSRTFISPFETPVIPDAAMQREASYKALQQSGGDLIIDGDYTSKITLVPLLFIPIVIYNVEGTVEGTSAKVAQVGARALR
jgi:hypothetical protein